MGDHLWREPFAKGELHFVNAPDRNCNDVRKRLEGCEQQMIHCQKKASETPLFSVVIPAHNNREKLRLTLECISQTDMDMADLEVVVVDDGSNDGTYEAFIQQKYPFHFKIFARAFGGQSAATNEAIRQATGKYLLSSAQDILFHKNIFKEHQRFHQKYSDQEIVVLGALPYAQQSEVTPFMFYLVNGGWQFAYYSIKDPLNVPPQFLYAPNFSIRREVLQRVGLFDEKFPFGSQDTDLGLRLAYAGVKIVYNPHAIGYHNHPIELANFLRRQEMAGASLVLLHEKHPLGEDLLALWDQVILNYLTFSATENDRCLDLIGQLETLYQKRKVDYESLWTRFFSHNIPLSNFSEADQKAIHLISVLFKAYDQILRAYWAKGFLKEALQCYGKKKAEEYLRGRLVKHQLSIQARRNATLRLRYHSLDVPLTCRDYLISLIVYGVSNYRAATDFLKIFIGPLTKAFNYQVLLVLRENSFSQQELAKLQQVADVVLCTNEDEGIIKALQISEAEIICIIAGKTKFDYGQAKANAESYFSKHEQIAVLWGSQTPPRFQNMKYIYQKGIPATPKTVSCAKKWELKHGPIETGAPEFFLIRGNEIQQILAHYHQIPLSSRRHWFEDICAIVQDEGKMVYPLAKLTARMDEPAENSKLVSIIILTYNQLEYTKKCLDSIFRHTRGPFELIIVDNGSTDGTTCYLNAVRESNAEVGGWKLKVGKDGEVVCQAETEEAEKVNIKNNGKKKERIEEKRRENRELACQYFKIIRNENNQGFAKGCNKGIEEARGEFLLLLNNDVLVTENWLSGLMECLQSAKEIGIVGPLTNQISGIQKVLQVGYQSLADLDAFARTFREENRHRRIPCRRIVGFCMLFRRELADRIGLLDENFGTGNFEDDDFCLRAELAGYQNMIAGDVFVHHFGSRSFVGNGINYHSALSGNRKKFDEKWNRRDAINLEGKKLLCLMARESARQYSNRDQLDQAVKKLLGALKLMPGDTNLYCELAEIFLEAKGFEKAIAVLKVMPAGSQDERRMALLGYGFEGLGKFEEAEEWAERALSQNAHSAPALNLKGILAYRCQKMGEAAGFFQKAIEMDKGYGEPYTNWGLMKWSAGQKEEAVALFEKGFILAPTIPDQILNYHAAVTETAQFARAEKYFREAMALHSFHKKIHFLLIDLLLRQGRHAEAMREIEEAMISFGVDEGILTASLEVRKRIGPKEIPAGKNRNSLSLCMIIKNEEQHLPQCLGSVRDLVDEILIVDTGSDDKTRDISTAFGAKVYEFPWGGDFSAARNFSLDQARGDWILILDADERIAAKDIPELRKLACQKGPRRVAYSFVTRNYTTNPEVQGWTPNDGAYEEEKGIGWFPSEKVRLFPNDSRVRFQGVVHEGVRSSLVDHSVAIEDSRIPIHHFGKLDKQRERKKGEEYYLLGKKKLENSGADVRSLRELAVQAGELERYADAADLWNQVITLQPDMAEAYTNLSSLYLKLKKYDQAYAASKQAVTLDPDSKEALLNFSTAGLSRGKTFESIRTLESLLAKNPEYPPALGVLSVAYVLHGEKERSSALIEKLRRWGFNYAEYLSLMSQEFTSMGKEKEGQMLHQMISPSEALPSPVCEPGLAH